jgi:F-box associated protein
MLNVNSNLIGTHGHHGLDLESSVQGNDLVLLGSLRTGNPVSEEAPHPPCLINNLPEDLILKIFENSKTDLPALASVNRLWKQITSKGEFYTAMFTPAFAALAFGKVDLKTHFGMDLGPEEVPRLRLKDYGDVEKGICLLTYFPKEIPIKDENGIISWVPPRAKPIGELVKTPKCGYATSFDPDSYFDAINEQREIKGGDWIVTYKKPIGLGLNFPAQVTGAEKQGEGTDVAELESTLYAVFMHYVKTEERCFPRDTAKGDYSLIRFKEMTCGLRIVCGFGPSGLGVYFSTHDYGSDYVGVAVSRKSIGTRTLGT